MKVLVKDGERCGFRFDVGDLAVFRKQLLSVVADFTRLELQKGQWIWIGGAADDEQTNFAVARGFARIADIEPTALTLDPWHWRYEDVDSGAGKTIEIYVSRPMPPAAIASAIGKGFGPIGTLA